jgi:hypothetical protein
VQSQSMCLAKEIVGHAEEEKENIFIRPVLNFETKSLM